MQLHRQIVCAYVLEKGLGSRAIGEREDDVPVAFDHGALVPIVSNFTPRENGDGLNVWHSGKREALEQFAALLTANDDADGEHRML